MKTKRSSLNWKNFSIFNSHKKNKSLEIWEKTQNRINEILEKGKTNERKEINQPYKIWDKVNIPRTDGRVTKAFITTYYADTWIYRVERTENWCGYYKNLTQEDLDSVNKESTKNSIELNYKIWDKVNIPRSDGRITKAFITAYFADTWIYRVERTENWCGYYKNLTQEHLESVNPKKSEYDDTPKEKKDTDETADNYDDYIAIPEVLYTIMDNQDFNTFRKLKKWNDEEIYIKMFWEPQNIVNFWDWKNLYITNCLINWDRKYIVWYIKKWNKIRLRLFYRSKSEWARRACPWLRKDWWYSKWADIPNSSYETTTRVPHDIEYKFDCLPEEYTDFDPITDPADRYEILETEMNNEIHIEKLYKEYKNDTCDSFEWESSSEVKNMYKNLWKNFNLKDMKLIEWEYYTYEHQYLWTIEVQICRLKYNWEFINFRFAKAKNDPLERVRIEEITYADAKLTSFGIYDRQINAAPLTGKPIEYSSQVPYDMKNNERINGSSYIDIRDLYQENPIIKQFKRISSI